MKETRKIYVRRNAHGRDADKQPGPVWHEAYRMELIILAVFLIGFIANVATRHGWFARLKHFFLLCVLASLPFALNAAPFSPSDPPLVPDSKLTPGAVMNVTVEQLCTKGYANVYHGGVRNVPTRIKRQVFIEYFGAMPAHPGDFEIDHLISLELGGSNDPKNLWPQSYKTPNWNAHVKDQLEDRMAALLRQCLKDKGHIPATALMLQFQGEISSNWTNAYVKYIGQP